MVAPSTPLKTETGEDGVTIYLPSQAPDKISSTVVVKLNGAPEVITVPIVQDSDGSISLTAGQAGLHGSQIQYESGTSHDNIGYWFQTDDWADWTFKVHQPGKFKMTAEIAAPSLTSFQVSVAGQDFQLKAPLTSSFSDYATLQIGTIELPDAGDVTLAVHPVKDGWQPMNIRSIKLEPVAENP